MSTSSRTAVTVALLRMAGGHNGFLDTLRMGLWYAYAEAGYPDGATEDGMFEWAARTMPIDTESPVGRDVLSAVPGVTTNGSPFNVR